MLTPRLKCAPMAQIDANSQLTMPINTALSTCLEAFKIKKRQLVLPSAVYMGASASTT